MTYIPKQHGGCALSKKDFVSANIESNVQSES